MIKTNKNPLISVIIPVYNIEQYLNQCLDSVINQTLKNIEIICIDDGSTDSSLSILEEYAKNDNRIKIFQQKNRGAGSARNKGIDNACGRYLYFLDSDDFLTLDALKILFDKITNIDADICICKNNSYNTCKEEYRPCNWEKSFSQIADRASFNSADIPDSILQICNIPAFTKLYNSAFIKFNELRFQEIKTCNDVYFNNISLILANSITSVDDILVTYREGHNNLSKTRQQHVNCILLAYKKLINDLKNRNYFVPVCRSIYKKAYTNFKWEISRISNPLYKLYWTIKLFSILPISYRMAELKKYIKDILKTIFSITNIEQHKEITILGIRIKIRKR